MSAIDRTATKFTLLALMAASASLGQARADSTFIEERKVIVQPGPQSVVQRTIAMVTPEVARSDYEKRLADLSDQINMGMAKGWLTAQQGDDLLHWQADVLKEEKAFRASGGGIIPRDSVDQLERHVNGLAYMISREISAGSTGSGL